MEAAPAAKKTDPKAGKRKGPLPLFLAQLLTGGAIGAIGYALVKFPAEVSEASQVTLLRKSLSNPTAAASSSPADAAAFT